MTNSENQEVSGIAAYVCKVGCIARLPLMFICSQAPIYIYMSGIFVGVYWFLSTKFYSNGALTKI